MITKRKFFATTAAIVATLMLGTAPVLAQGGNDPIEGIDIIIKKDPSSAPIKPFSMSGKELRALNARKDAERPTYVLTLIAKRLGAGSGFVKAGMEPLGKIWCGTCELPEKVEVKFVDGKTTYVVGLKFHSK